MGSAEIAFTLASPGRKFVGASTVRTGDTVFIVALILEDKEIFLVVIESVVLQNSKRSYR